MICLHKHEDSKYVYIPRSLHKEYLEDVLTRALGKETRILNCRTTNLCADLEERVSHSGSTVLRLALELKDMPPLELVVKILSPDISHLGIWSRIDPDFQARILEIKWARWWGQQPVSWVPVVYDTQCHLKAREFLIVEEYFPQVGWRRPPGEQSDERGRFTADMARLRALFKHVALFHAYSKNRINELLREFPPPWSSKELTDKIDRMTTDSARLAALGVTEEECRALRCCRDAVQRRPDWTDDLDVVCVTRDWKPDNFAIRGTGEHEELVMFDWGTTELGPMEDDLEVLLLRLEGVNDSAKRAFISYYLQIYGDNTGRRINCDTLMSRIPWVRFLKTLVSIVGWDPRQPRASRFVKMFIGLCQRTLKQLAFD